MEQITAGLVGIAALAAVCGVRVGNWTAMALLSNAIFSSALVGLNVPFSPSLWIAIDMCVILWMWVGWINALGHSDFGRKRDIAILALFFVIWPFYFIEIAERAIVIDLLVAAQMLLTFPVRTLHERFRYWRDSSRSDNNGILKAVRI